MTARDLIARAIHADDTNQPRMTELYIRNARRRLAEEVAEQRRQRARLSFTQNLIVARLNLEDAARPFIAFLDAFNRPTTQNDVALAGPSTPGGKPA